MNNFFGKYFKLTLIALFFVELLSFNSYLYPALNAISFLTIIFLTLVLSLKNLEYGIYILLAELFIGSKGYLFSLPIYNIDLSIRMGLFLVIMSVWLAKVILKLAKGEKLKEAISFLKTKFFVPYLLFFVFLVLGLIWAKINGNRGDNIFFDFNAWIFFLLIFPFFETIKEKHQILNIFQIFFAGLVFLGLETIFSFYVFSHQIETIIPSLYYWTRKTVVGEITPANQSFYRIFLQSQIYSLIGFFVIFTVFLKKAKEDYKKSFKVFILILICALTLLISLSRSFWAGLIIALVILLFILKFNFKESWKDFLRTNYYLVAIFLITVFLMSFLINFPSRRGPSDFASLFQKRILESSQDAAGRSRIDLFNPLLKAVLRHPLIGSGFGSTVTYKSSDPRVLEQNKSGIYTTYAFEWGYLDIWLKIGLLGMSVYLYLIWQILKEMWKSIKSFRSEENEKYLLLGMFTGLIALIVTNFFSPYLNHPLGIGYLILCTLIIENFKKFNNNYAANLN